MFITSNYVPYDPASLISERITLTVALEEGVPVEDNRSTFLTVNATLIPECAGKVVSKNDVVKPYRFVAGFHTMPWQQFLTGNFCFNVQHF